MTDPLNKAKLDEIEVAEVNRQLCPTSGPKRRLYKLLDHDTVLALVARARRADELEKRVAELEARVEYLS